MNIFAIQSFGSTRLPYTKTGRVYHQPARTLPNSDIVRLNHSTQKDTDSFDVSLLKERKEQALQKAEGLKRKQKENEKEIKKLYVNKKVKQAILNKQLRTKTLNNIVSKLNHNPVLMRTLFLEPSGGDVMLALPEKIMKRVCMHLPEAKYFEKFALSKDKDGKTFIEKASSSQIKIFNEQAKKFPKVLRKVYTLKNASGQIPAHYISPEALDSMNIALRPYPEILKKIYTTTDKDGNTPAHNRFYYGQAVIAQAMAKDIPTVRIMYSTANKDGKLFDSALTWAENYKGPYAKTWDYILQNF